jgi:hypothetical protein
LDFYSGRWLSKMLKYFIITILQSDNIRAYDCRVVNDQYKEVFNETLDEHDKDIFEKIMCSDKEALLYKTHEKLGKLTFLKIDEQQKVDILDGTKWP